MKHGLKTITSCQVVLFGIPEKRKIASPVITFLNRHMKTTLIHSLNSSIPVLQVSESRDVPILWSVFRKFYRRLFIFIRGKNLWKSQQILGTTGF